MGLDIYLYHCPERDRWRELEDQYQSETYALWESVPKTYEAMSEAEKDGIRERSRAIASRLGLNDDGDCPLAERVERDSVNYPGHLFKVGYFRSSYNERGINSVLRRLGVLGLSEMFAAGDEYEFRPDWKSTRVRVVHAIDQLRERAANPEGRYDCFAVSANPFMPPGESPYSEETALKIAIEETAQWTKGDRMPFGSGDYSSRTGDWFPRGMTVVGLLPGMRSFLGAPQPCVYVITKTEGDESNFDEYVHSLEIVLETIDYVLAQPDVENYYLHWSS